MSESNTAATSLDEAQTHRLLTLLTVSGLHLGMLQRELTKDGTSAPERMRIHMERIAQAQRAMVAEIRPATRDA
jgi:hypothetical protein